MKNSRRHSDSSVIIYRQALKAFATTLRTTLMSKGERMDVLRFRGQTIYNGEERVLTIGLITEQGNRMTGTDILLDSAVVNQDSATGVLNKKTVTDEATAAINLANVAGCDHSMYLMVWDIDDFNRIMIPMDTISVMRLLSIWRQS